MFCQSEAVRRTLHGLEWIVRTSEHPCVRLLDDRECRVEGHSLTIIPIYWIDHEIQNRRRLEDWPNWCAYRSRRSGRSLLKPPQCDPEIAMAEAVSMSLDCIGSAPIDTVPRAIEEHID